jgi:hypothetical protein
MAPLCIPFFGSVADNGLYPYVNTVINHQYAGKRVRIKILQWLHRPAVGVANLLRMDFSNDFYSNSQGIIAGINGTAGNTYNNVTYYQNNPGVGLFLPGTSANTIYTFFGVPVFEGLLVSPRLQITIRPVQVDPSEISTNVYTTETLQFGYAQLILDIEIIE